MWEMVNFGKDLTIQEILQIIDDSTCYGFEFKVENHSLFWREKLNNVNFLKKLEKSS